MDRWWRVWGFGKEAWWNLYELYRKGSHCQSDVVIINHNSDPCETM